MSRVEMNNAVQEMLMSQLGERGLSNLILDYAKCAGNQRYQLHDEQAGIFCLCEHECDIDFLISGFAEDQCDDSYCSDHVYTSFCSTCYRIHVYDCVDYCGCGCFDQDSIVSDYFTPQSPSDAHWKAYSHALELMNHPSFTFWVAECGSTSAAFEWAEKCYKRHNPDAGDWSDP